MAAMASALADHAPEAAIHLLLALRRCVEDVEWPAEGLAHAPAAALRCTDPLLQARGHAVLGPMLFTAAQGEAGLRHAELGVQCAALSASQRARALHSLARVRWRSVRRAELVEPLLDEAHALAGLETEPELRASLLALRGFVTNAHHRNHAEGERLHTQALALWEQQGNEHAVNSGRYNLAVCAQNAKRHEASLQRLAPIIASARELQDWRRLSQSLNVKGNAHAELHDWPQAVTDYRECIRVAWASMASFDLAHGLWNLPRALAHLRQPGPAVRLAAFAAAFWCSRFGELTAPDRHDLRRVRRLAARQIGSARVEALWREGAQLSLSQAVALSLGPMSTSPMQPN